MKRRQFILVFGGLAIAGGVAVTAVPRSWRRAAKRRYLEWFGPSPEELARALEESFAHLRLQPGTAAQFIADYEAKVKEPLALPLSEQVRVQFLLSTNFVQQRGREGAEIGYVALYSPYDTPCYNPFMFAHLDGSNLAGS